jgi:hypothetical protein
MGKFCEKAHALVCLWSVKVMAARPTWLVVNKAMNYDGILGLCKSLPQFSHLENQVVKLEMSPFLSSSKGGHLLLIRPQQPALLGLLSVILQE